MHKMFPNLFSVHVGKVTPTGKVTPFHGKQEMYLRGAF